MEKKWYGRRFIYQREILPIQLKTSAITSFNRTAVCIHASRPHSNVANDRTQVYMHAHIQFQAIVNCCVNFHVNKAANLSRHISKEFNVIWTSIGPPKNGLIGSNFAFFWCHYSFGIVTLTHAHCEMCFFSVSFLKPIASVCTRTQ